MYNFYNPIPEKRSISRNAHAITLAACEREKQRFQLIHEYAALVTPRAQVKRNRPSPLSAMVQASLRLLATLMG